MESETQPVNLALKEREKISDILETLLASTYTLYLKTQSYHWNVTGPHFPSYHALFQSQYEELAEAIDEIAERVRTLGYFPIGSFAAFARVTLLQDEGGRPAAPEMVRNLLQDQETLIQFLRKNLPFVEEQNDGATADFINKRLSVHEKVAWMLRSTL